MTSKLPFSAVGRPLFWLAQILPPAAILYLAFIPFDLPSSFIWMPAMICALVSIYKLVRFGLGRLLRRPRSGSALRLIRPALTVLCMGIVQQLAGDSYRSAFEVGRLSATAVQATCRHDVRCPAAPEGWRAHGGESVRMFAGRYSSYLLTYRVDPDRRGFKLKVRRAFDDEYRFTGGVDRPLAGAHTN